MPGQAVYIRQLSHAEPRNARREGLVTSLATSATGHQTVTGLPAFQRSILRVSASPREPIPVFNRMDKARIPAPHRPLPFVLLCRSWFKEQPRPLNHEGHQSHEILPIRGRRRRTVERPHRAPRPFPFAALFPLSVRQTNKQTDGRIKPQSREGEPQLRSIRNVRTESSPQGPGMVPALRPNGAAHDCSGQRPAVW
jgi:hypothetical protein